MPGTCQPAAWGRHPSEDPSEQACGGPRLEAKPRPLPLAQGALVQTLGSVVTRISGRHRAAGAPAACHEAPVHPSPFLPRGWQRSGQGAEGASQPSMTDQGHRVTKGRRQSPCPGTDVSSAGMTGAAGTVPGQRAQPPRASGARRGAPWGFPESRNKGAAGMLTWRDICKPPGYHGVSIFVLGPLAETPLETCLVLVALFVPFQRTVTWMRTWPAACADGRGLLVLSGAGGRKASLYLLCVANSWPFPGPPPPQPAEGSGPSQLCPPPHRNLNSFVATPCLPSWLFSDGCSP